MKYLPTIAGGLLGLMFIAFSLMFFFKMMPDQPPPPEGSPPALFMGALGPTGYMHFVKAFELIGGVLVAIPRTRNFGLLVLGPIILNILAFHVFLTNGAGIFEKPFILPIICLLALYLLWVGRKQFAGLAGSCQNQPQP
jgi:putative oxidoreductase